MKRFGLWLAIFVTTLGIHTAANANNVKIALTATLQEAPTPIVSTGATQYNVSKLRITEKDILVLLAIEPSYMPLPYGANLSYAQPGGFRILKEDGGIQYTVDSGHLSLSSLAQIFSKGVWGPVISANKATNQYYDAFVLQIDAANNFEANGFATNKISQTGSTINNDYKLTVMGYGKLSDKKCAISGTIKIKFTTPAV